MVLVALHFHQSPVLYVELDATSAMTARSRGPDRCPDDLLPFMIFFHPFLLSKKNNQILTDFLHSFHKFIVSGPSFLSLQQATNDPCPDHHIDPTFNWKGERWG
jgi:hypothetical protein